MVLSLFGCIATSRYATANNETQNAKPKTAVEVSEMKISSVFNNGDNIPKKYTCDGQDISPALKVNDVPATAKSLVLIVDDPDAPRGTWTHWTVWNIPPTTKDIPEGAKLGVEGITDFGTIGYGGPCPPSGSHTYRFKLYALDKMLDLRRGASLSELEKEMNGHVIAQAELDGEYQRA